MYIQTKSSTYHHQQTPRNETPVANTLLLQPIFRRAPEPDEPIWRFYRLSYSTYENARKREMT